MDHSPVLRFVQPTGGTVPSKLISVFERSNEAGLSPVWISECQVAKLNPTKKDVFVIDPFSGPAFDKVTNSSKYNCTVVGPRCLLSCLQSNTPVPELTYPMYTAAMEGLVVTCSGLDKAEKVRLQFLIERMAGTYSNTFHDGITHLVTSTVQSQKYEVAVGNETPVMTKEWVEDVWKVSCKYSVAAIDPRFLSHRCPALLGVNVSVSQLNRADKELLRKSIETHGGTYSGVLEMDKTTVLVCGSPSGDKYSHAKKWNTPCLTSDWVFDSIDKGYCLDYAAYRVERKNTSSPIRNTSSVPSLAEVSMCSAIMDPNETNNDTVRKTVMGSSFSSVIHGKTTAQWMSELDLARVKKAGTFLDGFKIYLSGFKEHDLEQLRRVLKSAGATRLTQLVKSVTHVVHAISTLASPDTSRLITELDLSPHNVAIQWLVESMKNGKPLPESDYPFPPPAESAQNFLPLPAEQEQEANTQVDIAWLAQCERNDTGNPTQGQENSDPTGCTVDGTNNMSQTQVSQFLTGFTLELVGFDEETHSDLAYWVAEAGGELVYNDFQGELDYLVTPCTGGTSRYTFKQHLSSIWLEDCLDQDKLLDIFYYHKIINIEKEGKPLEGVVATLSRYLGRERVFLNCLVESLGGLPQEIFAKGDNKDKGVRGCTHLVCPEGVGQKYMAALKWKVPVINCDWLVACLEEKKWVSEACFLVGDSIAVTLDKPMAVESNNTVVVEEDKPLQEQDEISGLISLGKISFPIELRRKSLNSSGRSADLTKVSGDVPKTPVNNASKISRMLDTPGAALDTATLERLCPQPANLDISVTRKLHKRRVDNMPDLQVTKLEKQKADRWVNQPWEEYQNEERQYLESVGDKHLDPDKNKEKHEKFVDGFEAKGIPAIGRDLTSFNEVMEETYKKMGKSWKTMGEDMGKRALMEVQDEEAGKRDIFDAQIFSPIFKNKRSRRAEIDRDLARMKEIMESVSRTPAEPVPRRVMKTTLTSVDFSLEKVKEEVEVKKESQILWVDPQEAVERAKLTAQLNAETQDLASKMDPMETFGYMDMPEDIFPMTEDEGKEKEEIVVKKTQPKVFMESGWSDQCISKAVEKLGGNVSMLGDLFDSTATHMLAVKVLRSEKMLASVASGKWVLHPDYVTASLAAGRWLAEAQYEWGNPEMKYLENCSSTEVKVAKAARKWRVANSDTGAFSGIQAILHMPLQKKGPFSRLIESGGGTVLDVKVPYIGPSTATHCFTEQKFLTNLGQVDFHAMAGRGILVMQSIFLRDLLLQDKPIKLENYFLN